MFAEVAPVERCAPDHPPDGGLESAKRLDEAPPELRDGICLTVPDDGCGMTPEVLERLFDPFFTTEAPGEYSGLGLSVVYGIVSAMGGVIKVGSSTAFSNRQISCRRAARSSRNIRWMYLGNARPRLFAIRAAWAALAASGVGVTFITAPTCRFKRVGVPRGRDFSSLRFVQNNSEVALKSMSSEVQFW
jgi:signal transduction histidine kinase